MFVYSYLCEDHLTRIRGEDILAALDLRMVNIAACIAIRRYSDHVCNIPVSPEPLFRTKTWLFLWMYLYVTG